MTYWHHTRAVGRKVFRSRGVYCKAVRAVPRVFKCDIPYKLRVGPNNPVRLVGEINGLALEIERYFDLAEAISPFKFELEKQKPPYQYDPIVLNY